MTTSVPMNVDDDKIKLNEPIPSEPDDVWTDMSYFRSKLVSIVTSETLKFLIILLLAICKHNS